MSGRSKLCLSPVHPHEEAGARIEPASWVETAARSDLQFLTGQLQATLSKWFKGQKGCVLASFDADDFGPSLKWEKARDGDLFPHVYGDVRSWQVKSLWLLETGGDGAPVAPDEVVRAPVKAEAKSGALS